MLLTAPVLPGLLAVTVEQEVERLPVVIHFITVVYDVEDGAERARDQQNGKGSLPAQRRSTSGPACAFYRRLAPASGIRLKDRFVANIRSPPGRGGRGGVRYGVVPLLSRDVC